MLIIDSNTTKKQILESLSSVATQSGPMYIKVNSLPHFLTTPIAFTVFGYQISNYPREIFWYSDNTEILAFLRQCGVKIKSVPQLVPSNNLKDVLDETAVPTSFKQKLDSLQFKSFPQTNSTVSSKSSGTVTSPTRPFQPSNLQANFKGFLDKLEKDTFQPATQLNADELFKQEKYQPSSLIKVDEEELNPKSAKEHRSIAAQTNLQQSKEETPKPKKLNFSIPAFPTDADSFTKSTLSPMQNLDTWLKKIQNTRDALSQLKREDETERWSSFREESAKKAKSMPKVFNILATSLVVSLALVLLLVFFPTKVYTLEVVPTEEKQSTDLAVKVQDFGKKTVLLKSETDTQASGQKRIQTERSTGRVILVNKSGNTVRFDKEGIVLIGSNGLEYRHLSNQTEPGTFSVPAFSDRNGGNVTINIQASGSGNDYNLPKDTTFKIYNLKGQAFGNKFQGIADNDIKNVQISGDKIVTDADYSLLRTNSESSLISTRQKEIKKLQSDKVFTNQNWFDNKGSDYRFSHKVGEVTDKVIAKATVRSDLYYLSQDTLEKVLSNRQQDIKSITDINVIDSSGDFTQPTNQINLKIFYTFTKESSVDKNKITQTLSNRDFEQASQEIKKQYPHVREIKKEESGINLPGIPSRMNLNIINKN